MSDTHVFDQLYKKLNPEQKQAVDTIEGPVMVIAGPGTGKTTILTLRIANILRKTDTPPSGILAITFTDAGVKAMRQKLREVIGSRADEVKIHTFHGFAASLIAQHGEYFIHLRQAKQMTDIEVEDMIRRIILDARFAELRPLGDPEYYIQKIVGTISTAKREAWTPEHLRTFTRKEIERIKQDESSVSTRGKTKGQLKADALKRIERCERTLIFADVYEAYEKKKREEKKMDFNDLIVEVLVALQTNELFLRAVQESFLYILVDEHQDTNDSQNMFIRLLADFFETPNIFIVGDEKQGIYRFQGASVQNFLAFQEAWPSMKLIALSKNYRSHQHILDAGFSLIERNYEKGEHENLRVPLVSHSEHEVKPIDVVSAGNTEAIEDFIAKDIQKRLSGKGVADSVAVIVRRNKDVERMVRALLDRGVDAVSERSADIFSHAIGVLFFNLIEFLSDPSQTEALAKTVAGGLWNVSFADSVTLVGAIKKGDMHTVTRMIPQVEKLTREMNEFDPLSYVIHAGTVSGLVTLASRHPLFMEVWRGIVALSSTLTSQGSIEHPRELFTSLISYRTSAEKRSVKLSLGPVDGKVTVMTAHGSKGLEYDYVYMPYATEEAWFSRGHASPFVMPREKNDEDEVKDTRRLFYVALTRAKKHVTILTAVVGVDGREEVPIRFIDELHVEKVAHIDIPAVEGRALSGSIRDVESDRVREAREYAKRVLADRGISVTALNHFITCPNMFYFKSILRVPEPPSASSEKGNAMHAAIAEVWASPRKSTGDIQETLERGIRGYMSTSPLGMTEREIILQELIHDAPVVARALTDHFSQKGTITTETSFDLMFEGIRLRGKLDAVLEHASGRAEVVSVFDYKTRRAMSENEIRGKTKNADGGYMRQLVFYKMLLEAQAKYRGKMIDPALVFVRPDEKGRCPIVSLPIEHKDVEAVQQSVRELVEWVHKSAFPEAPCEDEKCEWCKLATTCYPLRGVR